MASVGHVIVGLAATRLLRPPRVGVVPAAIFWSGLSLLPDADVIAFSLGIPYAHPWGHRGATHSFAFALAVGALVWAAARAMKLSAARWGLLAAAVVASHALLDTLTDGGLGCALLWPISAERFFAPWRPLPVAPIGAAFVSSEGLRVVKAELLAFAPLLLYACWPIVRLARRS